MFYGDLALPLILYDEIWLLWGNALGHVGMIGIVMVYLAYAHFIWSKHSTFALCPMIDLALTLARH